MEPTLPRAPDSGPPGPDLHPARHLTQTVFPAFGPEVYSAPARLIVWLLASNMQRDDAGEWSCWWGQQKLAQLAGVSVTTLQRVMTRELVDGPRPLLKRQRGKPVFRQGKHVNKGRESYTYEYVWNPETFAIQRDLARSHRTPAPPKVKRPSNLPHHPTPPDQVSAASHARPLNPRALPPAVVPVRNRTLEAIELYRRHAAGEITEEEYRRAEDALKVAS